MGELLTGDYFNMTVAEILYRLQRQCPHTLPKAPVEFANVRVPHAVFDGVPWFEVASRLQALVDPSYLAEGLISQDYPRSPNPAGYNNIPCTIPKFRFAPVSGYIADIPQRKTELSAGYDLASAESFTLEPGEVRLVKTGLKAYMPPGYVLMLFVRSSLAIKLGLQMQNQVGIIDADYVDNPDNEGHILVPLVNSSKFYQVVTQGDRIAQGIFVHFGITQDDNPGGARTGGVGSTGR